ncbi:hypothetical protein [Specibacter sp. RAF43]|uniref:hypothetical protein n=1 Tax=Specibacter sp. RAF43 TaxID=3233057 RepID=UPI003F9BF9FB
MNAAAAACVILAALAIFQALLIAKAPLGRFAWGGAHRILPPRLRIGSAVSIVLYGVFATILLARAGASSPIPESWAYAGTWVLAAYFLVGILMNAISRSRPERYAMTPVALVLAGLSLIVALS